MENTIKEFVPDINEALIKGTIVNVFNAEKITILSLSTDNLRKNRNHNYPKVLFFGDMMAEAAKFKKIDNVEITGFMGSSKRIIDNKPVFTQGVIATSIGATKKALETEFNVEDGKFEDSVCKIKYTGNIIKVELPAPSVVRFIVNSTKENGRFDRILATKFVKNPTEVLKHVKVGNRICVLGTLQTVKKANHDKTMHYENLVVTDIGSII